MKQVEMYGEELDEFVSAVVKQTHSQHSYRHVKVTKPVHPHHSETMLRS